MRASLAGLFLALLSAATFAGGGPTNPTNPNGDPDPSTNASSPGEEVTSLPMTDAVSGLTLVGTLRELRGLDLQVRGQGQIVVQRVGVRELAVTFMGDYRLDLERAALARSSVAVLFRGGSAFADGFARLQVGGSAPVLLDSVRVPLPIVRLAGQPRALGELVSLDVFSPQPHQAHVLADFGTARVTLFQRLR